MIVFSGEIVIYVPSQAFFVRWNTPLQGLLKINFDRSLTTNQRLEDSLIARVNSSKREQSHYGDSIILISEARALQDGV